MTDIGQKLARLIDSAGGPDACWPFLGASDPYGRIRWKGKTHSAHRATWINQHGAIPAGMFVCHRCDNPRCCNVKHLFLGTPAGNMADRDAKGRQARGESLSIRHSKKISDEQVRAIRADDRLHRIIAAQYGVDQTLISRIKRGQKRGHVT